MTSIANSLGFGSGLDVTKLVTDLAAASRDPKIARIDARATAVKSSISAVGQVRSDLETFSTSLSAVVAGGTLQAALGMSDATVLDAVTVKGSAGLGIDTAVQVVRLAQAQNSLSASYNDRAAIQGSGSFTLTVGGVSSTVTIPTGQGSLDDIAAAINDAGKGIAARVVNDGSGFRLVMRGTTGAAQAFSLTSDDAGLSDVAAGIAQTQVAQDAEVVVDGVTYTRPSNKLEDVVQGVVVNLKQVGTTRLTAIDSKDTYSAALEDFVAAFNVLKGHLAEAVSATKGEAGLRSLERQLGALVAQTVSTTGPASLGAIGVKTNRDGSLTFDQAGFDKAYANDAAGVIAVFVPRRDTAHTPTTDPGIGGALAAIRTSVLATGGALTGTANRLTREQKGIEDDRAQMEARETAYKNRLTKQFGNLDAKVGALKATQSYLTQQVALWTKST